MEPVIRNCVSVCVCTEADPFPCFSMNKTSMLLIAKYTPSSLAFANNRDPALSMFFSPAVDDTREAKLANKTPSVTNIYPQNQNKTHPIAFPEHPAQNKLA